MIAQLKQKSDLIGAIASITCMIHCIATPFLFIASACSKSCCSAAPKWWIFIDFIFLFISFCAVYKSTQTTTKYWMSPALWLAWTLLLMAIILEQSNWEYFSEVYKYSAATSLVVLHLYNLKFCQCKSEKCCSKNE